MVNKKGQGLAGGVILIAVFVTLLFVTLFVGFMMVTGSAVTNWVFDEAVPELSNLGEVGNANMTDIASYTIAPLNTLVQSLTWMTGVLYVLMLVASIGFALIFKMSPSKFLIGFYFMAILVLIIGSMFISNMYEDFYDGTDDLALRLKEHTLLSWMILYSPMVMTLIAFLTGIILFSGMQQEEFV